MSTKRYRLLKDFPAEKAGTIFDNYGAPGTETHYHSLSGVTLSEGFIKSNPQWFQLIEDEPKEFIWTDDLARELCEYVGLKFDKTKDIKLQISLLTEKFKSSHQSTKEEQPKRGWEIVAYRNIKSGSIYKNDGMVSWEYYSSDNGKLYYEIHSVKRLSYNEVFSVGDVIEYCAYGEPDKHWWFGEIDEIIKQAEGTEMLFKIKEGCGAYSIKYIRHIRHAKVPAKPQPTKEKIKGLNSDSLLPEDYVNAPNIKIDREKTEVTFLSEFAGYKNFQYQFNSTKPIQPNQFESVRKAIEEVLNRPEITKEDFDAANKQFFKQPIQYGSFPSYTQKEVDEIEKAAFGVGFKFANDDQPDNFKWSDTIRNSAWGEYKASKSGQPTNFTTTKPDSTET